MNLKFDKVIVVFTVFLVIASLLHFSPGVNIALAQATNSGTGSSQQPNINAANLFNTQTMTLGSNVKNLVILIPNEGHHGPGEADEARFLEQSFVPANAVVNPGTTVAWFNGDVGHEQTVNVKDATGISTVFTTGVLTDSQTSPTYTFNTPGIYNYEAIGDEGYVLKGTITVKSIQPPVITSAAASAAGGGGGGIDTVGVLMVPTQDLDTYVQNVKNAGLTVDSTHNFNDLRGGQSGTGDVQTLLVWASGGKDLNSVIAPISQLSLTLPYS
jgi:plastocyanin